MARLPHAPATPALTRAVRDWSGWFVVAAGTVLCVLGWYGISGESVTEQQLPYLASATIPGAALIVAGAVLIASRPARRSAEADERIETLYGLLVADGAAETETEAGAGALVSGQAPDDSPTLLAVPGGTLYHRRDCPLVAGKPAAEAVAAATVAERPLTPCPVCEPPAPSAAGPDQPAADRAATGQPSSGSGSSAAEPDRAAPDPDPDPDNPTPPAP